MRDTNKTNKLKPIVVLNPTQTQRSFLGRRRTGNVVEEKALLTAMKVTSDPVALKKAIGVRAVADVYRTLDKMSMRKEYHQALADNGITFDFIVRELKSVILTAEKDSDKVNTLKLLLKSIGMDSYSGETEQSRNSWEEALLKAVEEKKLSSGEEDTVGLLSDGDYEVKQPEIPESVKRMQKDEEDFSRSIYEG